MNKLEYFNQIWEGQQQLIKTLNDEKDTAYLFFRIGLEAQRKKLTD